MEFKVGDKVKYIGTTTEKLKGLTGIITDMPASYSKCYNVSWEEKIYSSKTFKVFPHNMELIPEKKVFKAGDRVKYTGSYTSTLFNQIGTVTATHGADTCCDVTWDTGRIFPVYSSNIELIPDKKPVDYLGLYNQLAEMQKELVELQQLCIQQHTKEKS